MSWKVQYITKNCFINVHTFMYMRKKHAECFFCTFFGLYTFETESHLVCQLPEADPQYKVSYKINRSSFDGTCI